MEALTVLICARRIAERATAIRSLGGIPNRDAADRAARYEREMHDELRELCAAMGYEEPTLAREGVPAAKAEYDARHF